MILTRKSITFILLLMITLVALPKSETPLFYRTLEKSFICVQVADVYSTYYMINKGIGEECNPFIKSYINKPFIVIGVKAILTASVLVILRKTRKKYGIFSTMGLIGLNALGSYVIYNNLK